MVLSKLKAEPYFLNGTFNETFSKFKRLNLKKGQTRKRVKKGLTGLELSGRPDLVWNFVVELLGFLIAKFCLNNNSHF
jgi:hypothetical protein